MTVRENKFCYKTGGVGFLSLHIHTILSKYNIFIFLIFYNYKYTQTKDFSYDKGFWIDYTDPRSWSCLR